jgi:hypothetical protein
MDLLDRILRPDILGVMIPIIAIVSFFALLLGRRIITHRERMAMIERGMHPDRPYEDYDDEVDRVEAHGDPDRVEVELPTTERLPERRR